MDQINALTAAVQAESATLDQITAAVQVIVTDLETAKTANPPLDYSGLQTAISSTASKASAILSALQAGDPNTVPAPAASTPSAPATPATPTASGS